jgi:hypothetical protein
MALGRCRLQPILLVTFVSHPCGRILHRPPNAGTAGEMNPNVAEKLILPPTRPHHSLTTIRGAGGDWHMCGKLPDFGMGECLVGQGTLTTRWAAAARLTLPMP